MDKVQWSKAIALEIIQAGFLRMAKKYHPDVGGTQEQILQLQETKDHLERILDGKATNETYTYQRAREEPRPRSTYRNTRSQYWDQAGQSKKAKSTDEVPLEDYADDLDYVALRDVTVMSSTRKLSASRSPASSMASVSRSRRCWPITSISLRVMLSLSCSPSGSPNRKDG
jgi:hypothetical protein